MVYRFLSAVLPFREVRHTEHMTGFRHPQITSCLFVGVLLFGQLAAAQKPDKVEFRNGSRHSRMTLYGTIEDYSDGKLTLRMLNRGTTKTILQHEVIDVQTPLVASHIKGLQAFRKKEFDSARRHLEAALKDETRKWVHQDIRALMVQVESRVGDHTAAMVHFAKLIQLDSKTRHLHLIPLIWHSRITTSREQNAARVLLTRTDLSIRLMGASVLLSDSKNSWSGESELQSLVSSGKPNLVHLARAQLWRIKLREEIPSETMLAAMTSRIASMPDSLKAGPYYLLGQAYLRRHEYDKAAVAFLRLPLVHDTDHRLAGQSALEAAEALVAGGRLDESKTLFREVATRFSDTPAAKFANAALKDTKPQ